MKTLLKFLLVEDSENDALLLIRYLQRNGFDVDYERVMDRTSMLEALRRGPWDFVIADYAMPNFSGLAALALLKEQKIDLPFVIVSGTIGEDVAVQAMKAGAHDYVMKGNLARLIPAIQREMDEAQMRRERWRAEEALHESENRYRGLFEGSKDAIYFSTVDGKIIDINPAGIELFGFGSKDELLAADVNHYGFIDPDRSVRKMELLQTEGSIKDFEYQLIRKNGTAAIVLETTVPVRDLQGTVTMYRSILRDVTRQKQLEQEFIQAQKMESIGTLAGGIAHDFNNILGIILGCATMLEDDRSKPREFSEEIKVIVQAVDRGASLVQQILTFARKTGVSFRQVNLADAASEMLAMLKETFPRIIVMETKFAENVPDIYADTTQIHQVLLNLCLNARDAMPQGGLLTLETEVRTNEQIREHFPSADQEKYVCLSITDTGEGMNEETRRRIFDPFFTTKEKGKGTGLGLSVVYGVMQSHLGFIDVESKPKEGTTFRLYFPVPTHRLQPVEPLAHEDPVDLSGSETILFVEDEDFIRDMVHLALKARGYTVYTATDAIAAIQVYQNHRDDIDLVVTDLGLSGMTGFDEFKRLKELNPDVKVIITSGFLDLQVRTKLLADGARAFIPKPYQPADVLRAVREVLD